MERKTAELRSDDIRRMNLIDEYLLSGLAGIDVFTFLKTNEGKRLFCDAEAFINLIEEKVRFVKSNQTQPTLVLNHLLSVALNADQQTEMFRWIFAQLCELIKYNPPLQTSELGTCLILIGEEATRLLLEQVERQTLRGAHLQRIHESLLVENKSLRMEIDLRKKAITRKETAYEVQEISSEDTENVKRKSIGEKKLTIDRAMLLIYALGGSRVKGLDQNKMSHLIAFLIENRGGAKQIEKRFSEIFPSRKPEAEGKIKKAGTRAWEEDIETVCYYLDLVGLAGESEKLKERSLNG